MGVLWFPIVAFMLAAYVILDGFDLGVGVVYLFVAETEQERQLALRSIGPVLDRQRSTAAGGGRNAVLRLPAALRLGFQRLLSAVDDGLWLLMLRGISIELRNHSHDALWRTMFDYVFSLASALLLALMYFSIVYWLVGGKVSQHTERYGH